MDDASKLDEWRWDRALHRERPYEDSIIDEYRRLVREDIRPPAEPDQDTLDTRAVLAAFHQVEVHVPLTDTAYDITAGEFDSRADYLAAKAALIAIKARVRREERAEMQKAVDHYAGLYAERCGDVLKAKADGAQEEREAVYKWLQQFCRPDTVFGKTLAPLIRIIERGEHRDTSPDPSSFRCPICRGMTSAIEPHGCRP